MRPNKKQNIQTSCCMKQINKVTYKVVIYFSKSSQEKLIDKIKRLFDNRLC